MYYGPEFTAKVVRDWLKRVGVQTLFIEPGSPWENVYNESFNGKFKDELSHQEICYSLREAEVLVEQWHREYNTIRPHSSLGLPSARSAGHSARSSVAQTTRIAGARSGPEGCGQTNLTRGTTLGGRSTR
jgi:putative transposase